MTGLWLVHITEYRRHRRLHHFAPGESRSTCRRVAREDVRDATRLEAPPICGTCERMVAATTAAEVPA